MAKAPDPLELLRRTAARFAAVKADLDKTREAIAIVGMACRFPGAPDLKAYWDLLSGGVDAITEVPADRWDVDHYYDPDPDVPGKMSTRWGGFIDKIDLFDPQFFSISPKEAAELDPQQRLLLELSWQALEHAGIAAASLSLAAAASMSASAPRTIRTSWRAAARRQSDNTSEPAMRTRRRPAG